MVIKINRFRTQKNEDESNGYGYFGHTRYRNTLGQSDERDGWLLQEIYGTHLKFQIPIMGNVTILMRFDFECKWYEPKLWWLRHHAESVSKWNHFVVSWGPPAMTCTFLRAYRSVLRQSNGMAHDHWSHYLAQFLASSHFPINSKREINPKLGQCISSELMFTLKQKKERKLQNKSVAFELNK